MTAACASACRRASCATGWRRITPIACARCGTPRTRRSPPSTSSSAAARRRPRRPRRRQARRCATGRSDAPAAHEPGEEKEIGARARSALHLREFRRRQAQRARPCRRAPRRRILGRPGRRAVQPAVPLWRRRARQDPSDARHRLAHPRRTTRRASVIYLSAEKFMYQFIRALRFKDTMAFKEQFRSVDVLMIDDVQFISGKDSTQEEFFHTFNALVDQNRQIIISADKSPSDLEGHGRAHALAAGLGPGRRYPPHDLRAAPRHPAGQGRAAAACRSRRRCWSSWRTRSPPTSASSKAR